MRESNGFNSNSFDYAAGDCRGFGGGEFAGRGVPYNSTAGADEPQDLELERALMSLGARPVVLCIGSDRVPGDCLGPLVGQILVERGANAIVYGTLRSPVTALNLRDAVENIRAEHGERKVLAVDAAVGDASDVGKIRVFSKAIAPGSADGKALPRVGDVSITATVTDPRKTPLAAVRLGIVYEIAIEIADRIIRALQ